MSLTFSRYRLAAAVCAAYLVSVALAAPVAAQNDQPPAGEPGTELDGFVGAAANSTHTGPVAAGIAGWRLTGWARAEARGTWLVRGTGADAFTADLGAAVRLKSTRIARPYVGAGFGLYHATFTSAGTSPGSDMSTFYRRRLDPALSPGSGATFNDPVFRVSAGVDWRLPHQVSLRPEASALFIRRDGHGETVALFGIRLGYRFEDRTVTP
jgi:hypothetical protein